MPAKAEIIICGAGIVGVAAAYQLVVKHGIRDVVLVDERPPLSLTTNYGTEAYRNWWPDLTMFQFMDRSITLMEELARESNNVAEMNRRGYVFLSADSNRIRELEKNAETVANMGGGALRVHKDGSSYVPSQPEGLGLNLTGADLLWDGDMIKTLYPFLSDDTAAMLHVRRCGWMNVPHLGQWMLGRILSEGGRFVQEKITNVDTKNSQINAIRLKSGSSIKTEKLVLAAGPLTPEAGRMLKLDMPVFMELHGKVVVKDTLGILPAETPMMFWVDPIELVWNDEERHHLNASHETRYLTKPFPGGLHVRPRLRDGKQTFLGIWTYDVAPTAAIFPPDFDPAYPMIVLRGLARMIAGMKVYIKTAEALPVDGGYYCKTPDNRPLIGPLPVQGAYIVGALSGYGVMGAHAAGELIAAYLTTSSLPAYANALSYERYEGMTSIDMIESGAASRGQL